MYFPPKKTRSRGYGPLDPFTENICKKKNKKVWQFFVLLKLLLSLIYIISFCTTSKIIQSNIRMKTSVHTCPERAKKDAVLGNQINNINVKLEKARCITITYPRYNRQKEHVCMCVRVKGCSLFLPKAFFIWRPFT